MGNTVAPLIYPRVERLPPLNNAAEKGRIVTVTRHDEPVARVIAYERMSAVAGTLGIIGHAASMQAVADHKAGKIKISWREDVPE